MQFLCIYCLEDENPTEPLGYEAKRLTSGVVKVVLHSCYCKAFPLGVVTEGCSEGRW